MGFRKKGLGISEAKEIDMVGYLSRLGFEPDRIRGNDYWYRSPLRIENTASFKINRNINRWYDHGMGKGGNLVDFGILFFGCSVGSFLDRLDSSIAFEPPIVGYKTRAAEKENKLEVIADYPLSSPALCIYLKERRIPKEIAYIYCREVRYLVNGKSYFGIGFRNDLGGWEIRNARFKSGSSPKAVTTFDNGSPDAIVFEGFMDFLSFVALHQNLSRTSFDYVVLNSLSFFEKAREFLERHERIRLYLDNDIAGKQRAAYALSLKGNYTDESSLYRNHKDLNDFLVNFGKPPAMP